MIWKGRGARSRGEEGGRRIGSGIGRGVLVEDGSMDVGSCRRGTREEQSTAILPEGKEGGVDHDDLADRKSVV